MGSTWTGTPILPSIAALFPSIAASFRSSSSGTVVTPAPFQEKRREVRYSTCDEVEVSLLDFGIEVPGVLRDVSKTGFCVELVSALKAGTRIKVSIRDQAVVFAVVRYCRPTLDTYQVGASIERAYFPRAAHLSPAQTGEGIWLDSDGSHTDNRDLARAIIDDHTLPSMCNLNGLADLKPVSDQPA